MGAQLAAVLCFLEADAVALARSMKKQYEAEFRLNGVNYESIS